MTVLCEADSCPLAFSTSCGRCDRRALVLPLNAMPLPGRELAALALRVAAEELLSRCTPEQRDRFARIYPNGLAHVEDLSTLVSAYDVCRRTLALNIRRATESEGAPS